jgi:hypothetical protein
MHACDLTKPCFLVHPWQCLPFYIIEREANLLCEKSKLVICQLPCNFKIFKFTTSGIHAIQCLADETHTDWLTDWLTKKYLTDWLTDQPTDWQTDWLNDRPTDRLTNQPTNQPTTQPTPCNIVLLEKRLCPQLGKISLHFMQPKDSFPSFIPVMSHMIPIHTLPSNFFKIHFDIIVLSTFRPSKQSVSFRFLSQNHVCISLHSHAFHMPLHFLTIPTT